MKRRGTRLCNPRLSAGGANRTNLNGVMSRFRQMSEQHSPPGYHPSNSDLMPAPRQSSFRPFNSRLQPVYEPRYLPQYPQYPQEAPRSKKSEKPIPRRGMFQNAQYSEAPPIDEEQIRRTEGVITRMVERSHRYHYAPPPNYAMRDSIRRAVYNLGVPESYRAQQTRYDEEEEEPPSRRRRASSEYSRHSKRSRNASRRPEYEEDVDDGEESEEEPSPPRKKRKKRKKQPEYEESDEEEEEEEVRPKTRKIEKRKKVLEAAESDEEVPAPRAPTKPTTPPPVSGPYIKDSDDDDNWKNSLPFMCKPNGAGAAMLERIGSAITALPLRDDTTNSYSDVALMLLSKSLKKLEHPPEQPDVEEEALQSQLMNMSTSWARVPRGTNNSKRLLNPEDDEIVPDTSLMRDISRIQHPDNISTLQIDSLFGELPQIPQFLESGRRNPMPPPRFQSSPISDDVFRSSEKMTMLSSIKKGPEDYGIYISDDEDENPKRFDIDDIIDRGASQLDFSYFPADPDISFNNNNEGNDLFNFSPDSPEGSRKASSRKEASFRNDFEAGPSKDVSKSNDTFNDFNSRFIYSPRQKKQSQEPMLDETTQRMFEKEFDKYRF